MVTDHASERSGTVLVGISNPATADRLVDLARVLTRGTTWEILLTHVVSVANQISLTTGGSSPDVVRARDLLQNVSASARGLGISARALVEVARSVEEGLIAAADSHEVEMILVGYSEEAAADGVPTSDELHFDRIVRRVARKASADVVVAKFRQEERRRIAVPLGPETPLRLTGQLCRALAAAGDVELSFLHVVEPDAPEERARADVSVRLEQAGLAGLGSLRLVTSDTPEEAIVRETADDDLVILGASGRPGLLDRVFSSRAQKIAESVQASVILAWGRDGEDDAS